MHPLEKLPQIQWLPAGTEPLSKFQQWYYEHGQAWNAKRKQKYHTDPAYREKILAPQRARYKAQAEKRRLRTTIYGKVVQAFSIREVHSFIGKRMSTIRHWENTGFIPYRIFAGKHRYYTGTQRNLLRELSVIMIQGKLGIIDKATKKAAIAAQRIKIIQNWSN